MAEITLSIESAPIALTLSAAQGPAGANGINGADGADGLNGADGADGADGATTWAELTDKTTAPIATENVSVRDALTDKAPLSSPVHWTQTQTFDQVEIPAGANLNVAGSINVSGGFTYADELAIAAHRGALLLNDPYFGSVTASGTVSANQLAITGNETAKAASRTALGAYGAGDAATFASVTAIAAGAFFAPAGGYYKFGGGSTGIRGTDAGTPYLRLYISNVNTAIFESTVSKILVPVEVTGNLTASGTVTEGVFTVGTTPAHVLGASIRISSVTGATIGAAVTTGGGTQHVVARSNGTQWICTAIIIP